MDRLGDYELLEYVADDPPWRVFRARLQSTGHPYRNASRSVDPERELIVRSLNYIPGDALEQKAIEEGSVAVSYRNDHIERIIEWNSTSRIFCVEPLVKGWRLNLVIDALSKVPPTVACFIARQVCSGLRYLHGIKGPNDESGGVVHGDVRPHTTLITTDGKAQLRNPELTPARSHPTLITQGPPKLYERMTPETIRGYPSGAGSDIFQLGLLMDEMMTGEPLFRRGTPFETLTAINSEPATPLSRRCEGVPRALDGVVLKALSKEPGDRFTSVIELDEALERVEDERGWEGEGAEGLQKLLRKVGKRLRPRVLGLL